MGASGVTTREPKVVAGLFAGVGGIELGLHRAGHETAMLCEIWEPARQVLSSDAVLGSAQSERDITGLSMRQIPDGVDLITAGFPCTDLSQAGRKAGIAGERSGLVLKVFVLLEEMQASGRPLPDLLLENVPNMLSLNRGAAMRAIVDRLDALGYRWAYRTIDSRSAGVPQRRRRVFLHASIDGDPRSVLLADDDVIDVRDESTVTAFGFSWTEGNRGVGWAVDAVPTLKGGSTLGIASPPAIYLPNAPLGEQIVTPSIEDAEEMQGFERGHTAAAIEISKRPGTRWALVGNAVTVGVAEWIGKRLIEPGVDELAYAEWSGMGGWPKAAFGGGGRVFGVEADEWPIGAHYRSLGDVISPTSVTPLSLKATSGFWGRLQKTNLGRHPGFREALDAHVEAAVNDQMARSQADMVPMT